MNKEVFWSKHADNFDKSNNYVIGERDMKIILGWVSQFNNLGSVLEIACGSGIYTDVLKNNADRILATDFSKEMVRVSSDKFKDVEKITVEQADAMELKYDDNSFDTVFVANFLHVTTDYKKVLDGVNRVLKPNGRIISVDFTADGMAFMDKMKLIFRFMKTYGMPKEKAQKPNFSVDDMRKAFVNSGFEVESVQLLGHINKAVVAIGVKK